MDRFRHGVVAERDGIVASVIDDPEDARRAVELLDRCESVVGAPLVDEDERQRLRSLAREDESAPHWHAVLGIGAEGTLGYAGATVPGTDASGGAVGDLAVARELPEGDVVSSVLAEAVERLAREHGARELELWIRAAPASQVAVLREHGYRVERRLAILGRELDGGASAEAAADVRIRSFEGADADQVVEVLAAAYEGTADGGWDLERFDAKRQLPWFDSADLLVAVDDSGQIRGLHWTKRRDDITGEVYNLAIHPEAQGTGIGGALLRAGLAHLAERGCGEVILWVDRDNERGVRLYESQGFTLQWEDVALQRQL